MAYNDETGSYDCGKCGGSMILRRMYDERI